MFDDWRLGERPSPSRGHLYCFELVLTMMSDVMMMWTMEEVQTEKIHWTLKSSMTETPSWIEDLGEKTLISRFLGVGFVTQHY